MEVVVGGGLVSPAEGVLNGQVMWLMGSAEEAVCVDLAFRTHVCQP